ncbi:MAG: organic solvent ABC transporter substrate-binding protein [Bdellovibrionaceae bacterium]|nr:organic solvent ABC transporter substrate-binding protein [Pseudobdellovibrionaceae bacterium]
MKKFSPEAKVGILVFSTAVLAILFGWIIGVDNPFQSETHYYVTYEFAGGIEVGSPVRVSGIKVGKVEDVDFFVPKKATISQKIPGSANDSPDLALTPVRLKIAVEKKATVGIREDSQFYINLAGIIGERYIEITPGSQHTPSLKPGSEVAGVDPPRIDQLISQSFDLAGKITELVEKNKGDITRSIELLYKLSKNFNQTLQWVDQSKVFKTDLQSLVNNLISITKDVKTITNRIQSPEGEKTLQLMYKLLWRLEPLDSKTVRDFLQQEGVKVQIF